MILIKILFLFVLRIFGLDWIGISRHFYYPHLGYKCTKTVSLISGGDGFTFMKLSFDDNAFKLDNLYWRSGLSS